MGYVKKSALLERIGQRIDEKRIELGLSKTTFAEKMNTSRPQLERLIKGETNPTILGLEKVCEIIGMNLSELVS